MYFSITWQKWCDVWIHLHILSAQLHVCGSWMWAPGQPAVLPAPGPGKEPETSPWGCAAVQLKTWPCLLCSCWPTTCFADKPAPLPRSAVGLPHWGSLWWVSLEEIDRFNVNYTFFYIIIIFIVHLNEWPHQGRQRCCIPSCQRLHVLWPAHNSVLLPSPKKQTLQ